MPQPVETIQFCENPIAQDAQRELVERVANSHAFSHSPSLRAFLLYVSEHAIAGRLDAVKEQQIGSNVLGRKPDYDPAEDNIVRVRARQLRQRLDDYFLNEGHHEPVVISMPKGHYIPAFQARAIELKLDERPDPLGETAESLERPRETDSPQPTRQPGFHVPAAVPWTIAAAAIVALCVVLWLTREAEPARPADPSTAETARSVWGQFFGNNGQEVTVVTADSGFALWQDITHRTLNLGAYLSRKYLQEDMGNPELREIAARRYTSPADLTVSLRLAEIARNLGGRLKVQFARSMDIHDVSAGNLVFLGSRRSNPWVALFEPKLNFVLDDATNLPGPRFRNKAPKPGEPKDFAINSPLEVHGAEDKSTESYAVAALLPAPSGTGMVVIIEGLSMEGTEAAGEFVTNLERFGALLRRIGLKKNAPVKPFEVMLKLTAVAGGYANAELIAYRYPVK